MRTTSAPGQRPQDASGWAWWSEPAPQLLQELVSGAGGLQGATARARLARHGPNSLRLAGGPAGVALLSRQFTSPIILILLGAALLSLLLDSLTDALIILAIVLMSGLLGFWQERSAARGGGGRAGETLVLRLAGAEAVQLEVGAEQATGAGRVGPAADRPPPPESPAPPTSRFPQPPRSSGLAGPFTPTSCPTRRPGGGPAAADPVAGAPGPPCRAGRHAFTRLPARSRPGPVAGVPAAVRGDLLARSPHVWGLPAGSTSAVEGGSPLV
ncbi:hypothetical protein KBZ16_14635 [Vulcanococcus limneticus Candia 3B3]|nr:hypothetical protein [Vulcanococcus limneticus Candia 3B3]